MTTLYSQLTKAKTQKCQQLPQKISKCSQTKKANKKITITQVQIIGGKKAKMMSNSSNLWIKVLQFNFKKSKGNLIMNTFRNKQFKNELDPKYAFYDCLRICELKSSSEKSLQNCVDNCDWKSSSNRSTNEKK